MLPVDPEIQNTLPTEAGLPEIDGQTSQTISGELQGALETIISKLETNDTTIRNFVVREAKKIDAFWRGFSKLIWDPMWANWRTLEQLQQESPEYDEYRETSISIFRSLGESGVAALTAALPKLVFEPVDAENPSDILAAQAFPKLRDRIERDNQGILILTKAAVTRWTQHFVAFYTRYEENAERYGTYEFPMYKPEETEYVDNICASCESLISEPDELGLSYCATCDAMMEPTQKSRTETNFIEDGIQQVSKGSIVIDVVGSLFVKIAPHARKLSQSPYLVYEHEEHICDVREKYPWVYDNITTGDSSLLGIDANDLTARVPVDWAQSFGSDIVTIKEVWLRPSSYNILEQNDERRQQLRTEFPDGCHVVWANRQFIFAQDSKLDDHWSMALPTTSTYLYSEPPAKFLLGYQSMRDDALDLMFESLEHGIMETFVDTGTIDLDAYSKAQKKPGLLFPATKRSGESLDSAIAQTRSAVFPKEALEFVSQLDRDGQQASGITPPIWGGALPGSTGTLGEVKQSRSSSLQRQSLLWNEITTAYAEAMLKACVEYRDMMLDDESFAKKEGSGFVQVWLRTQELSGNIGRCYVENSEKVPVTWDQREDRFLQLLSTNNQQVLALLFHPNNAQMVSNYLGFDDLYIPGADERNLQLVQIGQMLMTGIPVPVNAITDNNDICIEILKSWFNSPAGADAQNTNPQGWSAVLQQLQERLALQMQQQQQLAMQQVGDANA